MIDRLIQRLSVRGVAFRTGGLFQSNSLPGGTGTGTGDNGNLFDIVAYDITSFLTMGVKSLHFTDCPFKGLSERAAGRTGWPRATLARSSTSGAVP